MSRFHPAKGGPTAKTKNSEDGALQRQEDAVCARWTCFCKRGHFLLLGPWSEACRCNPMCWHLGLRRVCRERSCGQVRLVTLIRERQLVVSYVKETKPGPPSDREGEDPSVCRLDARDCSGGGCVPFNVAKRVRGRRRCHGSCAFSTYCRSATASLSNMLLAQGMSVSCIVYSL